MRGARSRERRARARVYTAWGVCKTNKQTNKRLLTKGPTLLSLASRAARRRGCWSWGGTRALGPVPTASEDVTVCAVDQPPVALRVSARERAHVIREARKLATRVRGAQLGHAHTSSARRRIPKPRQKALRPARFVSRGRVVHVVAPPGRLGTRTGRRRRSGPLCELSTAAQPVQA